MESQFQHYPTTWGPPMWFFIHTIAHGYPDTPNIVTKRKYYDFIQNLPLFIPNPEMGNQFSHLLDAYPVSPYLDCRESFVRWTNFIHNKVNESLKKEEYSYDESVRTYWANYREKPVYLYESFRLKRRWFHILFIFFLFCLILYFS